LTIGAYAADSGDFEFGWYDSVAPIHSAGTDSYKPLFAAGVSCHITDGFGPRRDPFGKKLNEFHPGIDMAVAEGTPVHAMASGTVVFSGIDRGFGNMVAIQADDGSRQPPTLVAAHMQHLFVATGRKVRGGDLIGLAGSTGRSTGPHVHLQLCRVGRRNRSGGFVCGAAENPYESWLALSAIARSSCAHGPIV
jgi:murein DD-endopeptidase MepM/ murein hydrolase activator NlpD